VQSTGRIKYAAFMLLLTEMDKARAVGFQLPRVTWTIFLLKAVLSILLGS
jgi:hypothetical protein